MFFESIEAPSATRFVLSTGALRCSCHFGVAFSALSAFFGAVFVGVFLVPLAGISFGVVVLDGFTILCRAVLFIGACLTVFV
jgi:hypothetical protein